MTASAASGMDQWADWLLHRRHGDDADHLHAVEAAIRQHADRVVDGAQLAPGMLLADLGSGDGAVALRAIERVGAGLRVVVSDVSETLLRHAESAARQRGVIHQCRFLLASVESLGEIASDSVDAVTLRAVLAYVPDKLAAIGEVFRILRPGGRLSIAEPIFQDDALEAAALRRMLKDPGQPAAANAGFLAVLHRWKAAQFPDTPDGIAANPLTSHSERDLWRLIQAKGFGTLHMELHVDLRPALSRSWAAFLDSSPHPFAPSLGRILGEQCSAEESRIFEDMMRPSVEAGQALSTDRVVYLTAQKPGLQAASS